MDQERSHATRSVRWPALRRASLPASRASPLAPLAPLAQTQCSSPASETRHQQRSPILWPAAIVFLLVAGSSLALIGSQAQTDTGAQQQQPQYLATSDAASAEPTSASASATTILPPIQMRPHVRVHLKDWTRRLSDEIHAVANKTNCMSRIKQFYLDDSEFLALDAAKLRDNIIGQINALLVQHRSGVNNIVAEAEKLAVAHNYVKNLRVNYTDVHRIRNELDPVDPNGLQAGQSGDTWCVSSTSAASAASGSAGSGGPAGQGCPQFTSINGGTPVPGPAEWQTPVKSIVMRVNKNFGDIAVNTSMSAVHLPLPIYAGLPDIMNGIAWTERLDSMFKHNLNTYSHIHHQYYGDHLGFLRTFPAHKWRIARSEPDLFDARVRPWYVAGASMPKDVVILVDTSGSMTGLRREIAKGVVYEILDTLTNSDHFAVLRFSETVTPVGFPKCNLRTPKLGPALEDQCHETTDARELHECKIYKANWDARGQYLRDHPNVVSANNASYLTDDLYKRSVLNVTGEIKDAYLLPATSRNIRYLKSNFTMPTAGIANFTNALMGAFELLHAYNRSVELGSHCNQAIMLITDGAIRSHDDIFNRYNYPHAPVRVFTYMIGREVGDITHTKAMACNNRGYYTHVINLGEVREQVQKYLSVMERPLVLSHLRPIEWTHVYGDETYQVLTDWVLEIKRRELARIMLNEERERLNEANSTDVINIEMTYIPEYDELPLVDEELKNRIICEDTATNIDSDPATLQSLQDEIDPLGYKDLACHWSSRRADLLTSVVKPVFDTRNTTLIFQRVLSKNIWTEQETHVRNAQLLGVASIDLRIADILRAAPSHLLGPNAYTILMGHSGFVMHHPDFRALLEDPFDKQSKILKPHFASVDLTHVEQVFRSDNSEQLKRRNDELRLLELRKAAIKRQPGYSSIYLKRAVDCRRRLQIKEQAFYFGPVKDTPFSFMLALPQNYGLTRLVAKQELSTDSSQYFQPSAYDLWTVHPDYRYCDGTKLSKNNSVSAILDVLDASRGANVEYDDLSSIASENKRPRPIVCDRELFPSLLFDAAATYDRFCAQPNCDRSSSSESCSRSAEQMRSKLASIHGLEMSFLATRSGLTRVRVFELSTRIKKLADLFIQRHNRAIDEAWYSRAVDWNMRFHEDATIITAPYNAYVRLIAKLRQRITQRHPAANDTRANCDPSLMGEGSEESNATSSDQSGTSDSAPASATAPENEPATVSMSPSTGSSDLPLIQNDEPSTLAANEAADSSSASPGDADLSTSDIASQMVLSKVNYNEYSTFDFLDLIANSSVHISATQSVIVNKGPKQRSAVAVTGLLYDYATFARRFLDATSLNIQVLPAADAPSGALDGGAQSGGPQIKVDICPNGQCPTRCGFRNDTIDCLLVDNNGYIVVGEELPHIGRSLADYDDKLMKSLVDRHVYHQVTLIDYQAICSRTAAEVGAGSGGASMASVASSMLQVQSPAAPRVAAPLSGALAVTRLVLANLVAGCSWLWASLWAAALYGTTVSDLNRMRAGEGDAYEARDGSDGGSSVDELVQWRHWMSSRSPLAIASAQSAVANQSLLAMLPNKTYLRPCEKPITLYETRPVDFNKLSLDTPEYYVTRCNCSGWYVYEAVPKTNLIMLIVNTTSSCRRCDSPAPAQPPVAPANFVPVVVPAATSSSVDASTASGPTEPSGATSGPPTGSNNKTAESQVCAMLERDSQLYTKRPDNCVSYHPDEAQIHICGSALRSASVNNVLLIAALLTWTHFCAHPRRASVVLQ